MHLLYNSIFFKFYHFLLLGEFDNYKDSVNLEIFASVLFSRNYMPSFGKIKSSQNGEIILSFTDIGKSYNPSR